MIKKKNSDKTQTLRGDMTLLRKICFEMIREESGARGGRNGGREPRDTHRSSGAGHHLPSTEDGSVAVV